MITFHEDTIEDSPAAVRNILNFAGIEIDKVRSPVDYLKSHYKEKFWTVEGYGGYIPLKKKDPEHERLACREEVNSLLSATYSFVGVDLVRDIEQRVKLEINNISDATLSILDEFVDYYKTKEAYR